MVRKIHTIRPNRVRIGHPVIKRILDILISLVALIVLSPFLIPIILLLRLTGEGEVWYKQKRIGFKNEVFSIWKFATMLKNSPNMGTGSLTVRDDPRVTPMGKYLRKSKINELPQILNVLKGDMSIVGPRPQMKVDFDVYPTHVKAAIYDQKPGITSIGSIVFRDEEKLMTDTDKPIKEYYAEVIAPYKGELELWYQKKANLLNDLKIIFLTGWSIIFPNSNLVTKWYKDMPKNKLINIDL